MKGVSVAREVDSPYPIRPRSIVCVVAEQHCKLRVAEDVCAGRFTEGGVTLELGLDPDWQRAGLADDPEWAIEWSKFYWGLDLAHAFHATGERRFVDVWERLVLSWIARVPVGSDASHVAARRIQNWLYAWDAFASAPTFHGLSPGTVPRVVESLAAQVRDLRGRLTPERNHRTLELYALFVAALALPALDPDGALLAFAIGALFENLLTDVLPDGVHRERSTHYHMIALRTYVGVHENARRFGVALPDGYEERLARACEFALHCHRPAGDIPALSDADGGSYLDLLERTATFLARADHLWVATAGARGVPPATRNASFAVGGYFVQRSGWGTDRPYREERHLVFDCGPLGDGGHGHYDALSVTVAAGGQALVVDPGRYTYSEAGDNWRRWFRSTGAHNTVCVDGLDQTPYDRSRPRGAVARVEFLGRCQAPGLDVLHGEVRSPCYEAVHRRRVVFVADEYWIIEDELRGERAHRFDLRFHLGAEAEGRTEVRARAGNPFVQAPGLVLVVASPYLPRIEAGWVSPLYGIKQPAPVVSIAVNGAAAVRFVTLVMPRGPEAIVPTLEVQQAGATTVALVRGTGADGRACDVIGWRPEVGPLPLGPDVVDAVAGWCRRAVDGRVVGGGICVGEAKPG